jgi:hypothetical protein
VACSSNATQTQPMSRRSILPHTYDLRVPAASPLPPGAHQKAAPAQRPGSW